MMDCNQYRRAVLADPRDAAADVRVHLESCVECTQYTDRLWRFEDRLQRALRVDAGPRGADTPALALLPSPDSKPVRTRRPRRNWAAAAASVLLGAAVAGGLWLTAPGRSLAADVVTHMADEPNAWNRTEAPVEHANLDSVMRDSQIRLRSSAGLVTYAHSCRFRGHSVPHLVVQTAAGPVTVMVLTHESTRLRLRFNDQGYEGVVVPVPGHGSIAVLERGAGGNRALVDGVAATVLESIDYGDGPS